MGYILPVTNFQSMDYHTRHVDKKGNSYFIEKPFQAILDAQHEVIKNKYDKWSRTSVLERTPNRAKANRTNEKITASLTGKGHLFSESI